MTVNGPWTGVVRFAAVYNVKVIGYTIVPDETWALIIPEFEFETSQTAVEVLIPISVYGSIVIAFV